MTITISVHRPTSVTTAHLPGSPNYALTIETENGNDATIFCPPAEAVAMDAGFNIATDKRGPDFAAMLAILIDCSLDDMGDEDSILNAECLVDLAQKHLMACEIHAAEQASGDLYDRRCDEIKEASE